MDRITDLMLMIGAAILGIAALWHFYWAAGGHGGRSFAIPEKTGGGAVFDPSPFSTIVAGCAIALAAALYAVAAAGVLQSSPYGTWTKAVVGVLGAVFLLRAIGDFGYVGLFKRHKGTAFATADTRYYSPLCLLLAIAGLATGAPAILSMIG